MPSRRRRGLRRDRARPAVGGAGRDRRVVRRPGFGADPLGRPDDPAGAPSRDLRGCPWVSSICSTVGVTGERDALPAELTELVSAAQDEASVPVAVGFGISTPEQAASVGGSPTVIIGTGWSARWAMRRTAMPRSQLSPPSYERLATPSADRVSRVQVVLFTVLGGCVMVIAYSLGIPGPICALLFLGGVFTGALLRYSRAADRLADQAVGRPLSLLGDPPQQVAEAPELCVAQRREADLTPLHAPGEGELRPVPLGGERGEFLRRSLGDGLRRRNLLAFQLRQQGGGVCRIDAKALRQITCGRLARPGSAAKGSVPRPHRARADPRRRRSPRGSHGRVLP